MGDDSVTLAFLELVNTWWLIVNAKELYHPNLIGNTIDSNTCDSKIGFLRGMNEWLTTWKQYEVLGFPKQTFDTMIKTNNANIKLSLALIRDSYVNCSVPNRSSGKTFLALQTNKWRQVYFGIHSLALSSSLYYQMIQNMSLCMFQDTLPVLSVNSLNAKNVSSFFIKIQ